MVRVQTLGVIRCMAASAGIWGIGVIAVVAGCTIIGNWDVSASKRIIIIVVGKSSRRPTGGRDMARSAIR